MSERLNSVDIEDVLSSIRRLVSDDMRPAAKPAVPTVAPASDPQADKLILTPALRIAPDLEPEPQAEVVPVAATEPVAASPFDFAPQAPEPEEPVMSFHSVRPERGAARLDAVMGQVARGLESGTGDWEAPVEPPTRFDSDWTDISPDEAATLEPLDLRDPVADTTAWSDDVTEAPFVDLDDEPDSDAAFAPNPADDAALDAPLDVLPGEAENAPAADLSDEGVADAWPIDDWVASDERPVVAPELPEDAGWAAVEPAPTDPQPMEADYSQVNAAESYAFDPVSLDPVALAEEPAMTETDEFSNPPTADQPMLYAGMAPAAADAVTEDMPDWAQMEVERAEPESTEPPTAAYQRATPDPRWADAAEAEIRRELEDEATASAFARFADDDLDDRPFDEDMLRDLVRDIIREELQGALGERITRNVRKLVRAEIARALAVRDFE